MKRILCAMALAFSSASSFAGWSGDMEIASFITNDSGEVSVGFTTQPADTCLHWGWYIKFDGTTPGGQLMYSKLLAAKASNKKVHVWYANATSPDSTDHTSGCTVDKMAVLNAVAIP